MNDTPQSNGSVDPTMASRVMGLFSKIDETLEQLRVPANERTQVQQNLMEAVAADLLTRLGGSMSEDDKQKLTELSDTSAGEPNLQEVASFFRNSFSQEELLQALGDATESVLTDFVKEMGK